MMRTHREDGVALVEAALAIPVLFLFIAGLLDLGMWAFNTNQAANAARDGARMAILDYQTVDVVGSVSWNAVVASVEEHLPGRKITAAEIVITCVDVDDDPVAGGCAAADPASDRVRIEVGWAWDLVTPIAGAIGVAQGRAAGGASMVILGLPLPAASAPASTSSTTTSVPSSSTTSTTTTTTAPTATVPNTTTTTPPLCNVTGLSASPSPNRAKSNGALNANVSVSFQANGAGCVAMSVQIVAPGGGSATQVCGCGSAPSLSWTYSRSADRFWSAGTATVRVLRGPSIIASTTFPVS